MINKEVCADTFSSRVSACDSSQSIEGKTFVITGKLSDLWGSRREVQEYLESLGAHLGSSVTKKTDYLVTNVVDSESEKSKKAIEYGTKVISEAEFNELIGIRYRNVPQITIPGWLKVIPSKACSECISTTDVIIMDGVARIGSEAFARCTGLTNVTIPKSVKDIGDWAFNGCWRMTDVVIPEGVTSIGNSAFMGCEGLTNITVPKSVTIIGRAAFERCTKLESIVISGSETNIGDGAFRGCKNLTSVTLPQSVTSIGSGAFAGCTRLVDPEGFVIVHGTLFSYCGAGGDITIPASVEIIDNHAFAGCRNLTSVTISDGTTSIGGFAFMQCTGLTNISIPESVTSIGSLAFCGCNSFTIHAPKGSYAERYSEEYKIPFEEE